MSKKGRTVAGKAVAGKTVGVFFGGRSNEHEISVITGMYAVNLLRGAGYKVLPVYLPRGGGMTAAEKARGVEDFKTPDFPAVRLDGTDVLLQKKGKRLARLDCALNCCHGGAGEDGTLSALLDWNKIPTASPGQAASAVFMHKEYSQIAARGLGIPVPRSVCVREGENAEERAAEYAKELGYPVIVKPVRLGSSIGVKVARNSDELKIALDLAFRLDDAALIEEYFPDKRDLNCAAYRGHGMVRLSEIEEVFSDGDILSFSEKYEEGSGRKSELPAHITDMVAQKVREYTEKIYIGFDITGVVRADFLLVGDEVYFNELNTVPGSLACYLFGEKLTDARAFLVSLVEEALAQTCKEREVLTTGILDRSFFSGRKGKRRLS